jgi:cytochrome c biogenesis protein CcmG/thiol:disulfide interchange protein DsbE
MFALIEKSLLLLISSLIFSFASAAVPEVGAPAPALKGTLFSGEPFDLAQMRGKVVLINFYSSYCKFCAYEIGNVETYQENNVDKDFVVIMVGVDSIEDRHRVERMAGIYNLRGLMADELEQSGFANRYPTPTTFVVDRRGILRSKSRGAKMPSWFREHVDPLLAEPG